MVLRNMSEQYSNLYRIQTFGASDLIWPLKYSIEFLFRNPRIILEFLSPIRESGDFRILIRGQSGTPKHVGAVHIMPQN